MSSVVVGVFVVVTLAGLVELTVVVDEEEYSGPA